MEQNQQDLRIFRLPDAGREAIREYLKQTNISTGLSPIDEVLCGGVEAGNFYLWLGASKSGKSNTLRALGMNLASNFPVLYVNFEQLARNVFAKLYEKQFGISLREEAKKDPSAAFTNILKLPDRSFYLAFWPDDLEVKSFRGKVELLLKQSIDFMRSQDPEKRTPVVVLENLSDIYNERLQGGDSLTTMVTQTAQDIKNFCIKEQCSIFLAHHTSKLSENQKRPNMDDVRDSKRVVDLAHSIFATFVREETDKRTGEVISKSYHLAYLAGRGQSDYREWRVTENGLDMILN